MSFSSHIGLHMESDDEFTRHLYAELVRRLRIMRAEPQQIQPSDWKAWIVPVVSSAVIAVAFFGYVYPQF